MPRHLVLAAASLLLFGNLSFSQAGSPACTLSGGGVGDGPPPTFERVADSARTIVEGTVQALIPAPAPTTGQVPIDRALLTASRVLKGATTLTQFGITQIHATGLFSMQPGQRFILFLNDDGITPYPGRPDVPLYTPEPRATLCIDAGKVWINRQGNFFRTLFDGVDLEKAVANIRGYVGLQRVNGRMVMDSGPIPNNGLLLNVPFAVLDSKWRPKIVLTPVDNLQGARRTVAVLNPTLNPGAQVPPPDPQENMVTILRTGVFTLPLSPGTYRVTTDGLPFGTFVKSISYGATDLLRNPLRIEGPAAGEVVVTLTQKPPEGTAPGAKVSGRMKDLPASLGEFQRPWVALVSEGAAPPRAAASPLAADGSYQILNVPPGNYSLKTALNNNLVPVGVVLGQPTSVPVVVTNSDITVDKPLFAGVAVSGRAVDKAGVNTTPGPGFDPVLTVTLVGATNPLISLRPARDLTYAFWLTEGEYRFAVRFLGGPGNARPVEGISSGSVDLLKGTLKIDGVTPVEPIILTLQ